MTLSNGHNIVVFGQTGSGKSSLINMLARNEVAEVSNAAFGATPSNKKYTIPAPWAISKEAPFRPQESVRPTTQLTASNLPPHVITSGSKSESSNTLDAWRPFKRGSSLHSTSGKSLVVTDNSLLRTPLGQESFGSLSSPSSSIPSSGTILPEKYTFWDTAGLNEDERGTVPPAEAYANLIKLAGDTGLNLIIYCMRASRFTEVVRVNYDLFWKIICDKRVPIVLVVTGLEQEEDMDSWWDLHKADFEDMGMSFVGHACVTTIRGRNKVYNREYRRSREKVWDVIREHCAPQPWRMNKQPKVVIEKMERYMQHHNARTTTNCLQEWLHTSGKFFGWVAKLTRSILSIGH